MKQEVDCAFPSLLSTLHVKLELTDFFLGPGSQEGAAKLGVLLWQDLLKEGFPCHAAWVVT